MIDTINAILIEDLEDGFVESARRFEIAAKGLFKNDARPPALTPIESGRLQAGDNFSGK